MMYNKVFLIALMLIGGPILTFLLIGSDPALLLEIGGGLIVITITLSVVMIVILGALMNVVLRKKAM